MNFLKMSTLVFIAMSLFISCASHPKLRNPSSENTAQTMRGFLFVEKNDQYQKFAFRDEGFFLISNSTFATRQEAINFCSKVQGYELSSWLMPLVMAMGSLPFEDLRINNVVGEAVLSGEKTMSGEDRTGVIFWVKEKTPEKDHLYDGKSDLLYAMLDGCGPNCDQLESLSDINLKLKKLGKPTIAPQAICVDQELKKIDNR